MNALLLKYLDYIVEHQLRNDAGVRAARDKLQGHLAVWPLAVRRYLQVMGNSASDYLAFRKKWAFDQEKVDKLRASEAGTHMLTHIAAVAANFKQQEGVEDYTLGTGPLDRSLPVQVTSYMGNWSVLKFAADLLTQVTAELEKGKYPDPPDAASAKKLARFIVSAKLAEVRQTEKSAWRTSPTSAAPGLSDHGRLSAIDFVIQKHGNTVLSAQSVQIPLWRKKKKPTEPSFAERLKTAIDSLNQTSGTLVFKGPLPDPDEPWHYTYLAMEAAEERAK